MHFTWGKQKDLEVAPVPPSLHTPSPCSHSTGKHALNGLHFKFTKHLHYAKISYKIKYVTL